MTERKVCVVTGSRAEYGLLRWLMQDVRNDPRLRLQVAVTGMHLAPQFGSTFREIEGDGFAIDARVEMLVAGDGPAAVAKSVGFGVIGFADAFQDLKPDIVVLLGDRFEILAAAQAALFAGIPIAHIHGGELTEGAVDDSIRHALTKMSHLHFAAAEPYRRRIVQMGELPERVFTVGAPGVDNVGRVTPMTLEELGRFVGMKIGRPCFVVTYHPETLAPDLGIGGARAMLDALDRIGPCWVIFTSPNADTGGQAISEAIAAYVARRPERAVLCASLGQRGYLSALRHVDVVVGNSSSGLIEVPAAGVPTVNIGDRQKGRLRSASVIDCEADAQAVEAAIRRALTPQFRQAAKDTEPAYGAGDAARRICEILATVPLERITRKPFHDQP